MSTVILELNDSGLLAQANGKRVLESPGSDQSWHRMNPHPPDLPAAFILEGRVVAVGEPQQ